MLWWSWLWLWSQKQWLPLKQLSQTNLCNFLLGFCNWIIIFVIIIPHIVLMILVEAFLPSASLWILLVDAELFSMCFLIKSVAYSSVLCLPYCAAALIEGFRYMLPNIRIVHSEHPSSPPKLSSTISGGKGTVQCHTLLRNRLRSRVFGSCSKSLTFPCQNVEVWASGDCPLGKLSWLSWGGHWAGTHHEALQ